MRYVLVSVLFFVFLGGFNALAQSEKMTPVLQAEVQRVGSGSVTAWVYFTDKGSVTDADYRKVENGLTEKARARRMRNRQDKPLVDFYDLPVKWEYVQSVAPLVKKIRTKSRWLNALSVEATPQQLDKIARLSFVKKLDLVRSFTGELEKEGPPPAESPVEQTHTLDYGSSFTQVNQINVPALHDLGYNGSGVLIAMLDAGFNNLQHEALAPLHILKTWDFVNGDSIVWDEPGQMGSGNHGTQTLGTIAGFKPGELIGPAYGADFILAKTENTDYERHIEEDHWVAGAEWADSLGADIISSSLGYRDFDAGQTSYTWQDMDGNTTIVVKGADLAASRGILVVNSAGNEGSSTPSNPNTLGSPADGDSVLAVGAVSSSGNRVSFSSMGPTADGRIKPDVMAMGSGVKAPSTYSTTGYSSVSGTSFSCPLTAGAAALVLQVNPNLTNMQIIKALRETAANASSPNNEYGWGIIDAYAAAAFYYTPQISHAPLTDTEDVSGPYTVTATITSQFPLAQDSLQVLYRYDAGPFQAVTMQPGGNDQYVAEIPGPGTSADVSYYIRAKTDSGTVATHPANAPTDLHQFHVGPDQTAPTILHSPLQNVAHVRWPARVVATISDNMSVDDALVYVEWKLNGTPQTNFNLQRVQADQFEGYFNTDTHTVHIGDVVEYRIHAADLAAVPNVSYHPAQGYHQFTVLQTRGLVLVIDDESGTRGIIDERSGRAFLPKSTHIAADDFTRYLNKLGYLASRESSANTDPNTWGQYDLIISASGENTSPVSNATYQQALVQYVQNGGKLLVEGGEIGYDAASSPGYPDFAAQVLHITNWNGDHEGPLQVNNTYAGLPLLTTPHTLPAQIALNYDSPSGWADQDAVTPDAQSIYVYSPQQEPGKAGILVYDDNNNLEAAQIVYYAFDFASVADTNLARNLLENTVEYLIKSDAVLGVGPENGMLPGTLELYPNFPNPFNPETVIRFYLPRTEEVTLEVYNSLGQKVATLLSQKMEAGFQEKSWRPHNLSSGVYYLLLKAGGQRRIEKALLMK
ncbi:MAG: hypothetical protein Kow0037_04900 [Calditrichia bacterium]